MEEKKIICLVIPSLSSGGMERVMSQLSIFFCKKNDVEVHLVMYGIKPEIFYTVPKNLIIHQPDWCFENSRRFWHTLRRLIYLRRTVNLIQPTTILSFGEYWNSFVLLALLGLKFRIFVSDRCQPDKKLGFLHDLLRRYLYSIATGIVAQTKVAREIYLKQFSHSNIRVIGNPITIAEQESIPKEKIVLTVGRLIDSKHHDLLIDIFLKINLDGWKLVIVGGDSLRQNGYECLITKIKDLKVEDRVELTGNVKNVNQFYNKSSIFAFTSSSEGFPNVIGEAMSYKLPVVAFDCVAGPSEMIDDGKSGFLVPLFDSESFELKLAKLMKDQSLREKIGDNAQVAISKFSNERICKRFYEVIMQKA